MYGLAVPQHPEQPLAALRDVEPAHPVFERVMRETDAHVFRGDVLDHVRLVEDRDPVLGQERRPMRTERQLGKEEVMIHDQQVRVPDPVARAHEETALVLGALGPQAVAVFGAHRRPHIRIRLLLHILDGAVGSAVGPRPDPFQFLLFRALEQLSAHPASPRQPPQAKVVAAPLDQHRLEIQPHVLLKERDVLADQLFLERNRVRRDNGLDIPRNGGVDQRDEVREAFTDSRPRFDSQMMRLLDRVGDRRRHFQLLRTRFVGKLLPRAGPMEPTAGAKERLRGRPDGLAGFGGRFCSGRDHTKKLGHIPFDAQNHLRVEW